MTARPESRLRGDPQASQHAIVGTVAEVFNEAQHDVVQRSLVLIAPQVVALMSPDPAD